MGVRPALLTQSCFGCSKCFIDFAVFDLTVLDIFGTSTGTGRCWELAIRLYIEPLVESSGDCIAHFILLRLAQNLFNVFASGVDAVIILLQYRSVKKSPNTASNARKGHGFPTARESGCQWASGDFAIWKEQLKRFKCAVSHKIRHTSYSATASFHDLISAESSQISAWLESPLALELLCFVFAFLDFGIVGSLN